jgi:hypothetical protein
MISAFMDMLTDFTPDVAKKVIGLWQEYMGFFYNDAVSRLYVDSPELLVKRVGDSFRQFGRFDERITSSFSDDSKLQIYPDWDGKIKFECYAQTQSMMGKERRDAAEKSQNAFNEAVRKYIDSLK